MKSITMNTQQASRPPKQGPIRRRINPTVKAGLSLALSVGVSMSLFAQGPYYPVTNPGGTLAGQSAAASAYTGSPVTSTAELDYLEKILQESDPLIALQPALLVPPTTFRSPTHFEYNTAVQKATISILGGTSVPPVATPLNPAVTLVSFSRQAINTIFGIRALLTQTIAASIIAVDSTQATTRLDAVLTDLAVAFPSGIKEFSEKIMAQAATSSDTVNSIPQFAAKSVGLAVVDLGAGRVIIESGIAAIASASAAVIPDKDFFVRTKYIPALLNDSSLGGVAMRDALYVDNIVWSLTKAAALALVPASMGDSSIKRVLQAVYNSLPNNGERFVGGVAIGALRNVGLPGASALKTNLLAISGATAPYTNNLVDGFTTNVIGATDIEVNSLRKLLSDHGTNADAIAAGAIARGTISSTNVVQNSLRLGITVGANAKESAAEIIAAVISANVYTATVNAGLGATATLYTQYGFGMGGESLLFAGLAKGAISTAGIDTFGDIVYSLLAKTTPIPGAPTSVNVNSILKEAITAAYDVSREGGVADMVYETIRRVKGVAVMRGAAVVQAIETIAAKDPSKPGYIAVVAALANGLTAPARTEILQAAFGTDQVPGGVAGALDTNGADELAAKSGADLVLAVLAAGGKKTMSQALASFATANSAGILAGIYGVILTQSDETGAVIAAAVRQSGTPMGAAIVTAAQNALRGIDSGHDAEIALVEKVASDLKNVSANRDQIFNYIGLQVVNNLSSSHLVATAATIIDPNHAHYISHSVAFNNPTAVAPSVTAIFKYAQITSLTPYIYATAVHSNNRAIKDQPAAAAAITAGITSGILEARLSATNTRNALSSAVTAAVLASISQEDVPLLGQAQPFFNNLGDTSSFRQSNGTAFVTVPTAGNIVSGTVRSVGAAGAVTGYIAQVTALNDQTISATTAAVLQAATAGAARTYAVQIVQAAAQAFRWVVSDSMASGGWQTASTWAVSGASLKDQTVAAAIANAILPTVNGFNAGVPFGVLDYNKLYNAALFGLYEAANGTLGAGALGLNATGLESTTTDLGGIVVKASGNTNSSFYRHRSATGTPVTDIFNL